ncbi:hypothetical protein BT96DRAFT_1051323 [Gymnopus androsaceus JB14]|uniref:Rhodopsin domain-containing protein n=1 Tax=Gymnopus androsaceus JB14 TaxID=1447944 RepID=A0A6A4I3Z1_9AGAR|nr:hypothetical protein BT96DRAFT_1051323 [Gymnopus androsaceus JB14]
MNWNVGSLSTMLDGLPSLLSFKFRVVESEHSLVFRFLERSHEFNYKSGGSTTARLWIRYRKQRLWWDDGWAILTMILSTLVDVSLLGAGFNPIVPGSPHMQIVLFWLDMTCFTVAVWCARISLMLSIVRLIPPLFTLRRISEWAAVSFSLICVGILTSKIYVCASDESWYNMPHPQCDLGKIAVGQLHCLLTSAMSVVHSVFVIGSQSNNFEALAVLIINEAEAGTALAIANLGVLTPYIYRLIGKREVDIDSKPYTHYPSIQTNGDIRMRRVSDLVASGIRLTDSGRVSTSVRVQEPEPPDPKRIHEDLTVLGPSLSSDSNASPLDGTDSYEIPKTELVQDNSM